MTALSEMGAVIAPPVPAFYTDAETLDELAPVLEDVLADGDLVLAMGAGDISAYAQTLPELLGKGPSLKVHS